MRLLRCALALPAADAQTVQFDARAALRQSPGLHHSAPDPAALSSARAEARAAATPEERRRLAENLIDRRRRLLEEQVEDPRRGEWLLDQAEDLLLLLLPSDGSDLLLFFGRPTAAERRRAVDLATEALRCLREFEAERPPFRSAAPAAAPVPLTPATPQRTREALLRGAALLLSAAGSGTPESAKARQEAVAALSPLPSELEPAGRRLALSLLALALDGLDQPREALALLAALRSDPSASTLEQVRAELAAASIHRRTGNRREAGRLLTALAERTGEEDLFTHLLIADQRSWLQEQLDGGPQQAWLPYRALLAQAKPALRPGLRPVLLARTAALAAPGMTLSQGESEAGATASAVGADSQPPFVRLASLLAREAPPDAADADLGLLRILERDDLPAMERTIASLALGERRMARGDGEGAAAALLEGATRNRGEPESIECAEGAAEIVTALWNTEPTNGAHRALAASTYARVLEDFPELPRRDAWSVEAARLALQDGRLDEVERLLQTIDASSALAKAAQVLRIEAGVRAARAAEGQQRVSAWRRLLEAMATAPQSLDASGGEAECAALALFRAEALLEIGEPGGAIRLLDSLPPLTAGQDAHAWHLTLQALQRAGALEEAPPRAAARTAPQQQPNTAAILGAMLVTLEERCRRAEAQGWSAEASLLAAAEMLPLAEALLLRTPVPAEAPTRSAARHHAAARGLLRAGRPSESLALIEEILAVESENVELLLTKAECLERLGGGAVIDEARLAEAMSILKRIAASTRGARDRSFWLAEALQLEILLRLDRSVEQVAPRVAQLRLLDPTLGGPGSMRRLEAAAAAAR